MSQNQEYRSFNNDDIDVYRFLQNVFRFLTNYRKILISFALVGVLCGAVLFKLTSKKFSANMMVQSTLLSNAEVIQVITNWNDLLERKETGILSQQLNTSPLILSKLRSIEATEIMKLFVEKNPVGFVIEVKVTDTTILNELQQAIIYGLENGEYVKFRVEAKKEHLTKLMETARQEIITLDSTKTGIEKALKNGNGTGASLMVNVSDVNVQAMALKEKFLGYADELKFVKPIRVIQSFVKYTNPVEPNLIKYLGLGILVGLVAGYIVALSKSLHRRIGQLA